MAGTKELKGFSAIVCKCCGTELPLQVCRSAAGFYLGHLCPQCGPYSRETGYMTLELAEMELAALKEKGTKPSNARNTNYHGVG